MSQSFDTLELMPELITAVKTAGFSTPTAIQSKVIPLILDGKNVVAQSATGTGKTLAYLLPLLQKVDPTKRENQAIILAPTHELVMQIHREVEVLIQNAELPITAASLIGNVNIQRQIDKLKEKPQILVGSAGRVLELIQKKKVKAQNVKTIVFDEADRLLDEHNFSTMQALVKTTLKDRQVLLFSATITKETLERAKELAQDLVVEKLDLREKVPAQITHQYFITEYRDKIEVLRKLVRNLPIKQAMVFVNKSEQIDVLSAKLNFLGFKVAGLYGTSSKGSRQIAVEDFRQGRLELLVASDLAARGLDIPGIKYVIHFDLPEESSIYLHRVGRTGRAGQTGTAISLVTHKEVDRLQKMAKKLGITVEAKNIFKGKVREVRKRVEKVD